MKQVLLSFEIWCLWSGSWAWCVPTELTKSQSIPVLSAALNLASVFQFNWYVTTPPPGWRGGLCLSSYQTCRMCRMQLVWNQLVWFLPPAAASPCSCDRMWSLRSWSGGCWLQRRAVTPSKQGPLLRHRPLTWGHLLATWAELTELLHNPVCNGSAHALGFQDFRDLIYGWKARIQFAIQDIVFRPFKTPFLSHEVYKWSNFHKPLLLFLLLI